MPGLNIDLTPIQVQALVSDYKKAEDNYNKNLSKLGENVGGSAAGNSVLDDTFAKAYQDFKDVHKATLDTLTAVSERNKGLLESRTELKTLFEKVKNDSSNFEHEDKPVFEQGRGATSQGPTRPKI